MTAPRLIRLAETDSTNADAFRRLDAGQTPPFWIMAERQTAGRGRRGRSWTSLAGNLFATGVYRMSCPLAEAAQLSFVAALAVADLADAHVDPAAVALKWPNDVLLTGRKVAGVLLESRERARGLDLVVGIGVNLAAAPDDAERPATAFLGHGSVPGQAEAFETLAAAFERWRAAWAEDGFAPIRKAWLARAAGLGSQITARGAEREATGVFTGLDETGALVLDAASGREIVRAGEIYFTTGSGEGA